MDKLRNGKFDVVLADALFPCSDIVSEELNVPLVFTFRAVERMCGQIPAPPSFVPATMSKLTDKMNFKERIINMLLYLSQDFFSIFGLKRFDNYYTEYLGELKESSEASSPTNEYSVIIFSLHVDPKPYHRPRPAGCTANFVTSAWLFTILSALL